MAGLRLDFSPLIVARSRRVGSRHTRGTATSPCGDVEPPARALVPMSASLARAAPPWLAPRAAPASTAARRSRRPANTPTSSSATLRARAKAGGDDADGATSRAEDAQRWIDAWRETLHDAVATSASIPARAERESATTNAARVSSARGGDFRDEGEADAARDGNRDDDESASDDVRSDGPSVSNVTNVTNATNETREPDAKAALLRAARLTDRGLNVGGARQRAALNERVAALEATFRFPDDSTDSTDSIDSRLAGSWRLAYTDAFETLAALRVANAVPGVTAGQLRQRVELETASAENVDASDKTSTNTKKRLVAVTTLDVSAPLFETRSFAKAKLTPVSPRRLRARTLEAGLEDCKVVDTVSQYVSPPASVTFLGVDLDTEAAAAAADPARDAVKALVTNFGDAFAAATRALGAETVAVPVPESFPGADAWILTTYADADVRVARGEGGSVYLFERVPE